MLFLVVKLCFPITHTVPICKHGRFIPAPDRSLKHQGAFNICTSTSALQQKGVSCPQMYKIYIIWSI